MSSLTSRQMINNELAARYANTENANKLQQHMPKAEHDDAKIAFNCECSDKACDQRILLTLKEYAQLHQNFARFIIVKGHEEPKVEQVVASTPNVSIVEKGALT